MGRLSDSFAGRVQALSGIGKLGAALTRAGRSRGKLVHQIDAQVDAKDAADLQFLLTNLKARVVRRLLKQAVVAAGRVVAKEVKQHTPVDTGLLRKSIRVKGIVYPSGTAVAVIGPRKGFGKEVERDGKTMYADPVKYAHLVELGHVVRNKKGGPALRFVPPNSFLRAGLMQSKARARAKLAANLRAGVAREAQKMVRKGKRG